MQKLASIIFLHSLFSLQLSAAEKIIPNNPRWLFSINGENFLKSKIGSSIAKRLKENPQINQKLLGLKMAFGVDLFSIKEISIYGTDWDTLTLINGGLNSVQLEGLVSLLKDAEVDETRSPKIFSFSGGAFCPLSIDMVTFASHQNIIKEALVKKDKENEFISFIDLIERENPTMITFGLNLYQIPLFQDENSSELESEIKKLQNIAISLAQSGNDLQLKIFFQVKDNKVAGHLENILRSWPSLLALLQGNHSTIDEVLTLLQFSVDRENNTVSINSTLNLSFFFSEGLDGLEKDEAE